MKNLDDDRQGFFMSFQIRKKVRKPIAWPRICNCIGIMEEQSYFGKVITNIAGTLLVLLSILLIVLGSG